MLHFSIKCPYSPQYDYGEKYSNIGWRDPGVLGVPLPSPTPRRTVVLHWKRRIFRHRSPFSALLKSVPPALAASSLGEVAFLSTPDPPVRVLGSSNQPTKVSVLFVPLKDFTFRLVTARGAERSKVSP